MPQFGASLTVINYAPNIFIIQATDDAAYPSGALLGYTSFKTWLSDTVALAYSAGVIITTVKSFRGESCKKTLISDFVTGSTFFFDIKNFYDL